MSMMRLKKSDVNEEEVRNDLKDLLYKVPSIYYVSKKTGLVGGFRKLFFYRRILAHLTIFYIYTQVCQWSQNEQSSWELWICMIYVHTITPLNLEKKKFKKPAILQKHIKIKRDQLLQIFSNLVVNTKPIKKVRGQKSPCEAFQWVDQYKSKNVLT